MSKLTQGAKALRAEKFQHDEAAVEILILVRDRREVPAAKIVGADRDIVIHQDARIVDELVSASDQA